MRGVIIGVKSAVAAFKASTSQVVDPEVFARMQKSISAMTVAEKRGFMRQVAKHYHTEIVTPVDEGAESLRMISCGLECKLSALGDDVHAGTNRKYVLGNYYRAYLKIEESLIAKSDGEDASFLDGRIKFFRLESLEEKARGVAVVAKMDSKVVGRLFMAKAPLHDHLTILWVGKCDVAERFITAKMFETYFEASRDEEEKKVAVSREVRTSCVGSYADYLQRFATDRKHELVDMSGNPHYIFPAAALYDISKTVMKGIAAKPGSAIISAGAGVVERKSIIERE